MDQKGGIDTMYFAHLWVQRGPNGRLIEREVLVGTWDRDVTERHEGGRV